MKPDGRNLRVEVKGIFYRGMEPRRRAHRTRKQQLRVDLGGMAEPQDILRREGRSAGFVKVRLDGHRMRMTDGLVFRRNGGPVPVILYHNCYLFRCFDFVCLDPALLP